jgi:signal transduction histidine kinase
MFNKDGIPFFIIIVPFLAILFISFFSTSYYLKLTNSNFKTDTQEFKLIYTSQNNYDEKKLYQIIIEKEKLHEIRQSDFKNFMFILTIVIFLFMILFSMLMSSIINDVIKKYKKQVQNREEKLETLNKTLSTKVENGIEEGKQKDRAILQQSKLARMGAMISMIAHQWRQPLTELSGILMELETATRFKKVNDEHILNSIDKSDKMIEFMSNTIDDFRNFYKPDKKKEVFDVLNACKKAISLVNASLTDSSIILDVQMEENRLINGYPTEFAQVILNLISNAKDILDERNIENPKITIKLESRGSLCILKVKDNAGGLDIKNFDLIFDPYFTTKESSKGTGLGLYISKLIIERNMGGELSVENDEEGAVFKIVLLG